MAFWIRRRSGQVTVYTMRDGKQSQLPRAETRHLDSQPDCNVRAWVRNFEITVEQREFLPILTDRNLENLKNLYIQFITSEGKDSSTIYQHQYALERYIFTFFIENDAADPHLWPHHSIRFRSWMLDNKRTTSAISKCNIVLRAFWKYHIEEGRIASGLALNLRPPKTTKNRKTPLKATVTPDKVLSFVKSSSRADMKIIALCGYFFSLRSQEILALSRDKFKTGSNAIPLECCKVMRQHNLYNRMAVYINEQRIKCGVIKPPKANSIGWVACFNEEAAKLLVGLLRNSNGRLFEFSNDYINKLWRENGIKGVTIKDLRRSSLYWLGHYTTMDYIPLKNHARHADPTTTWLYLRRPDEGMGENFDDLDLEA